MPDQQRTVGTVECNALCPFLPLGVGDVDTPIDFGNGGDDQGLVLARHDGDHFPITLLYREMTSHALVGLFIDDEAVAGEKHSQHATDVEHTLLSGLRQIRTRGVSTTSRPEAHTKSDRSLDAFDASCQLLPREPARASAVE